MVDIRDERETAALIKSIREDFDDWRAESLAQFIWVLHELVTADGVEPAEISDEEAREIMDEMPTEVSIYD